MESKNQCNDCEKKIAHKQSLHRHRKSGCGKRIFPCPNCLKILGRYIVIAPSQM